VGDIVVITDSSTSADEGVYVISVVTSNTVLTLNRALTGVQSDVGFYVVADAIVIENDSGTPTPRMVLPSQNDAATPTLAFGDGDTGFYESSDDEISIATNSTARLIVAGDFITGRATGGFRIRSDGAEEQIH
jgi:hypothetical protein